jgi:hypothetical protein
MGRQRFRRRPPLDGWLHVAVRQQVAHLPQYKNTLINSNEKRRDSKLTAAMNIYVRPPLCCPNRFCSHTPGVALTLARFHMPTARDELMLGSPRRPSGLSNVEEARGLTHASEVPSKSSVHR